MADTNPARIAFYVASEAVAPGASNLIKGNYKQGLLHAIAGAAAAAVYGPAGALLVAADSVHKAVTDVNLYDRLGLFQATRPSSTAPAREDHESDPTVAGGASSRRRPPKEG